jgi:hypothetical protein
VFLILFVLSGKIFQSDKFLITEIEIKGNDIINKEDILNIVKAELNGRYLFMFPKNNFLLYPRNNIVEKLNAKYLRLKNVTIETNDIFKLQIYIEERKPNFVWCPQKKNNCYYLDNNGLVFDTAPDFSEGVFFKFQGGLHDKEKPDSYLAKNLIETDKLNKLIKFKDEAENIIRTNLGIEWSATSIEIMDWDDFSVNFSGKNNLIWKVLFVGRGINPLSNLSQTDENVLKTKQNNDEISLETNLISVARNLEAVVISDDFKSNYGKKNQIIDYIDLRFGNKVFYKFINK